MKNKLLLVLSIVFIALGGTSFIAGAVLTLLGYSTLGDVFMGVSSLLGVAALLILVFRLFRTTKTSDSEPRVVVKIVDVKDVPKTREEQLYEQYEDLYKKDLITKEDLDLKRKELLGK